MYRKVETSHINVGKRGGRAAEVSVEQRESRT